MGVVLRVHRPALPAEAQRTHPCLSIAFSDAAKVSRKARRGGPSRPATSGGHRTETHERRMPNAAAGSLDGLLDLAIALSILSCVEASTSSGAVPRDGQTAARLISLKSDQTTRTARKSLTFVWVGPVTNRSSRLLKKP